MSCAKLASDVVVRRSRVQPRLEERTLRLAQSDGRYEGWSVRGRALGGEAGDDGDGRVEWSQTRIESSLQMCNRSLQTSVRLFDVSIEENKGDKLTELLGKTRCQG